MQIDRLTLTNFRGFANSTLDFTPGFNLIVGINGAGKTSVLEALRVVLAKSAPEFFDSHLSFPGIGLTEDDITIGREAATLSCALNRNGQSFDLTIAEQRHGSQDALPLDRYGARGTNDIPVPPTGWRGRRPAAGDLRLDGTLRGQTSAGTQGTKGLQPPPDPRLQQAGPKPLVLFLSVRRAIVSNAVSKANIRHPAYQRAFAEDRGLAAKQLADWWRGRAALASEQPNSRAARQLMVVEEALQTLLPHLSGWRVDGDELKVTKVVDVAHLDANGENVVAREPRRIRLQMLSDGERSLVAIGADIAQRLVMLDDDSENPLATGTGVVLIDELDLHLHPQWQRTVVEGLRSAFPNLQFICSTHSLFLIQAQRTGNLIRLDSTGDEERPAEDFHQMSIEDIAEEVQGVEIPQKSQRYLSMMAAAQKYYTLLRGGAANPGELEELKRQLDELSTPFSDDPAFQALLKQRRLLALGDGAE
jgi:predicted ATP-binding protein involved in virulence